MVQTHVPVAVYRGIRQIVDSDGGGAITLESAIKLAEQNRHYETARWIRKHPRKFAQGLLYGFEASRSTALQNPFRSRMGN